jgi:hypothetical protein
MSDELGEKVAEALRAEAKRMIAEGLCSYKMLADAAIALVLEEAAKVAEDCCLYDEHGYDFNLYPQTTVAAAIRALKGKTT